VSRTIHVIGAGLAGLAAAVRLVEAGARVIVHEAAKAAGGRCRTYHDSTLDLGIDNGNHLLLSGNVAALDYAARIGGIGALDGPDEARFDFADLGTGERWTLHPNAGRLPWWILVPGRRVPGTRARDYLGPLGILRAKPGATIGEVMACSGPLWERLWHPVLLAALNTEPCDSAASLAGPVLRETLGAGGRACRPLVATGGLSAAFVDPALAFLSARGAEIRFGARLRAFDFGGDSLARLVFAEGAVELGPEDGVVLAVPPWVATDLLPGLTAPTEFRSIVNAHFKLAPPRGLPVVLGIVGALSEWLFAYPDRLSVTISGADRLLDVPREELAMRIWAEVAGLTGLHPALPAWQIVKEKRATFAATPAEAAKRPGARTHYSNLALAGDWTDTGLPATIEGAVRSGNAAASLLQREHGPARAGVSKA
jgi:squalene-associated FAD-dependent desaturase